jgi:hypothetical protein
MGNGFSNPISSIVGSLSAGGGDVGGLIKGLRADSSSLIVGSQWVDRWLVVFEVDRYAPF